MQTLKLKEIFRAGSKSFSLAAIFFRPDTYQAASQLYAWCRYCDDIVDQNSNAEQLPEAVENLRRKTRSVFRLEPQVELPFAAFQEVVKQYNIPEIYALELIEGMAMDARKETYETFADLEVYAYRVAGTVGMMMTYVLGAAHPDAQKHAKQLGIAMQLTNISRDILEDAQMDRCYLPLAWLRELGLAPEALIRPDSREKMAALAARLVNTAELYYEDGNRGLRYLRFRNALAIRVASSIYRAIGHLVVQRGPSAWDTRAVVPLYRKLWEIILSTVRVRSFS